MIKEFSARAGLTTDTVRFYEKRGLLNPARGKSNRYRRYGEADLEIVPQIKIGQALGFTLAEIKRGSDAWRRGSPATRVASVNRLYTVRLTLKRARTNNDAFSRSKTFRLRNAFD